MADDGEDGDRFVLSFDVSPTHVGAAQFAVMMLVRSRHVSLEIIEDVRLAVDELLHAIRSSSTRPRMTLEVSTTSSHVSVRCEVPADALGADLDIMRTLVDDMHQEQQGDTTVVSFRRRFDSLSPSRPSSRPQGKSADGSGSRSTGTTSG